MNLLEEKLVNQHRNSEIGLDKVEKERKLKEESKNGLDFEQPRLVYDK